MTGLAAPEEQSQAASWCIDSIRRPSFPATPVPVRPTREFRELPDPMVGVAHGPAVVSPAQ
jgi:hypothetical protein